MADSSRTDGSRAIADAPDADRDAKIEQLLLAGLDHYFAARYESAINVWTRALFFDRSHARARAYIDRARSALAERQRRSEELLESGVAALDRGHGSEARRLLQAAVESGARADELHPLLDRLNRHPGGGPASIDDGSARPTAVLKAATQAHMPVAPSGPRAPARSRFAALLAMTLLAVVAVGGYSVATWEPWSWLGGQDVGGTSATSPASGETELPPPTRAEMALGRARALALRGRLHEALSALDLVRATDTEKFDADRLRGDIQRQLLELSPPPSLATSTRDGEAARQP
jgi:tetratricopeptide (TPR) repeat protein